MEDLREPENSDVAVNEKMQENKNSKSNFGRTHWVCETNEVFFYICGHIGKRTHRQKWEKLNETKIMNFFHLGSLRPNHEEIGIFYIESIFSKLILFNGKTYTCPVSPCERQITGAGHGIGKEIAIKLAALGCIVVCWDIDEEANRSTISKIIEDGGEAYGYLVDVSKRLEVRETVRMMRRNKIPNVTILINNAAILYQCPFLEHNYEEIEKTFGVNVLSHFWTLEAFLPTMMQNHSGHVISMSSMCGFFGVAQKAAYCSSKFAVRGLMDSIREELRFHPSKANIHFTTIYPFYVDTGLAKDPEYRFPYLFRAVTAEYAAEEVIKALRRNYTEHTIPRCLFPLNAIIRLFPASVKMKIVDFLANETR